MILSYCSVVVVLFRAGVWEADNVARKVEGDWNMVYLARTEGTSSKGTITWKVQVKMETPQPRAPSLGRYR